MTTRVRETDRYLMVKSLAGMGISFVDLRDDTETGQTLWDTELSVNRITYLIGCTEKEFNFQVRKIFKNQEQYV